MGNKIKNSCCCVKVVKIAEHESKHMTCLVKSAKENIAGSKIELLLIDAGFVNGKAHALS
jgi:hypothetical protein